MHSTLSDLSGLILALLTYPLLLIAPGFVLGRLTNIFSFQHEAMLGKFLVAIILSISIFPNIYYLVVSFVHISLLWLLLGIFAGITVQQLYISLCKRISFQFDSQIIKIVLSLIVFWGLLAFLMVDLEIDGRLYSSLVSYDYVKHVAVTDAISRTGIPPINPSFYPGESLNLFYYYFWFIFTSLVDQIGGDLITPRHSVFAGIMWISIGLIAITWMFLKKFGKIVIPDISARYFPLALTMLAITGLDLVPIISHKILEALVGMRAYSVPSIEWWNEQIASWFSSIIWVPHHVSAFISTIFVFLALRECVDGEHTYKEKFVLTFLSSLALTSAFGMSIWVTIVFMCFLVVWFFLSLKRKYREELFILIQIGLLSLLLIMPYVIELQSANHLNKAPIVPSVRAFFISDELFFTSNPTILHLSRLFFLPVNYFLEIGFFFLGGLTYLLYRRSFQEKINRQELYVLVLLVTSIVVCTFFKANIKYNDLGWRGFMFAQIVLLLYSTPLYLSILKKNIARFFRLASITRVIAIILLLMGLAANLYEVVIIRTYSLGPTGERGMKLREMYEWIEQHTAKTTIIQHNPNTKVEYFHALYGNRQVMLSDETLGKLYGVNDQMYEELYNSISPIYEVSHSFQRFLYKVDSLGLNAIVVKNDDPIWQDSLGWMKDIEPTFENSVGRVYLVSPN